MNQQVVLWILIAGVTIFLCILTAWYVASRNPRSERRFVRITDIEVLDQHRKPDLLGPLILDIARKGQMRPIDVLYKGDSKYILLDGCMRLLACKSVGQEWVDCVVYYNIDPIEFGIQLNRRG